MNTEISVIEVAMTANTTWLAPRMAAAAGGSPRSTRRWMFSSTTMASSTTMPMARISAKSVRMLIEKPKA